MLRLFGVLLTTCLAVTGANAAVTVRVDINRQTMAVQASTGESYTWPISTGRIGYATPSGVYRPQRLERFWRSRKYGMAPMPHSVFFRGGYAIHGTSEVGRLGRPASHGCIRLHPGHAATLYGLVQRHSMAGTRIVVSRDTAPAAARQAPRRARPRIAPAAPAYYYPEPPAYFEPDEFD